MDKHILSDGKRVGVLLISEFHFHGNETILHPDIFPMQSWDGVWQLVLVFTAQLIWSVYMCGVANTDKQFIRILSLLY